MKKILILTSALILLASVAGCECLQRCRGSRLFTQQPVCVPVDPCDPCDTGCGACGTAAPAAIVPGPETYVPVVP